MIQSLDVPVVSLAVPNIHKMNEITSDDLSCMWTVFTKCKDNLENGRRLENLSWRLWYRESLIEKAREQHVRTPIPIQSNNNISNDYFSYVSSSASSCESSLQTPPSLKHMSSSSFKRMISSLDNPIEKQSHYQQHPAIQLLPTPSSTPVSKPSSNTSAAAATVAMTTTPKTDAQSTCHTTRSTKTTTAPLTVVAPQPKKAFSVPKPQRKFYVSDDEESEEDEYEEDDEQQQPMLTTMHENLNIMDEEEQDDDDDDDDGCWSTVRTADERHFYSATTRKTPAPSLSNKITISAAPTASETDFVKKTPTFVAKQPQPSLLSAMFARQQPSQQRSSIRNHSTPSLQRRQRRSNAAMSFNHIQQQDEPELSQSLSYCVDWEQRQNALSINIDPTSHPYQKKQKPLEMYNNYWESFRGW
ncbi:hypothetical protein BDA99DRAFT_209150 [Phascolomyces articulosus]|uniref:Nitrogen regulatory protein areA GATA-like domain-containing protein n=1 Tax=Phascolomyces articulosus TaxID=60185 RepID=A0AAD5K241_9FUNG|nr:hypothetical protein BDA99DRAFT_209150 [Phascolomyces articulosus]